MFLDLSKPALILDLIRSNYDAYRKELKFSQERLENVVKCESPIESMLLWSLMTTEHGINNTEGLNILGIHSQWGTELEKHKVRFDIFIRVWYEEKEIVECYIIECDGHEFHQKTKEQATRDRWRDRLVARYGLHLLRFTGTEIYRRPQDVAIEIFDRILSDFRLVSP